ncbi:MAG: transposase [Pirellulales bacterium]
MDSHIADLDRVVKKIAETEERMEAATKDDDVVQKLRSTKGVGLVTAVVMRAEIGDFNRFASGKQLARYSGGDSQECIERQTYGRWRFG